MANPGADLIRAGRNPFREDEMESIGIEGEGLRIEGAHEASNDQGTPGGRWPANVGSPERWVSAAAGIALIGYGLRKRSWLGSLLALAGANLLLRGALGKSLLYKAFGVSTAKALSKAAKGSIQVEKSVTVDRPSEEIYRFWRNVENLPRVMGHLKDVRSIDGRRSHWVAKAPAGMEVEWDAEITEDLEGRRIAWRSLPGSEVSTEGAVSFEPAPDGRGTEVRASLSYQVPGGKVGAALAKLFGEEPGQQIDEDLRKFKRMLETGEIAHGQYAR